MTEILLLADSLSGTGHQRRAELLCRALLGRGYGVTYLSHGLHDSSLRQAAAFRYVAWPSYDGTGSDPDRLVATKLERLRLLQRLRHQLGPFAALICEHFPIGKLYLREEVALLGRCFKAPGTRLIAVYRDIVDDGDLAQAEQAAQRLNEDFDHLLVLSDARHLALPAGLVQRIRIPVTYLGFLDPRERQGILVFGGGGKLNDDFYRRTLDVLQRLPASCAVEARFFTGSLMSDSAFEALRARAGPLTRVARSTTDLFAEMGNAAITVSTLGYNTFVDLLHLDGVHIVVPLAHNDEQMTRARVLARIKSQVKVIALDADYESSLSAALGAALPAAVDASGLRSFVRVLAELCPLPGGAG
jgi:predicted glycosyltransferase